jgi:hypothetical protein
MDLGSIHQLDIQSKVMVILLLVHRVQDVKINHFIFESLEESLPKNNGLYNIVHLNTIIHVFGYI